MSVRYSPPQNAFSSGELSPLLHARFDYQRFQTGLAACRGFMPLVEGGVTRAPGTWYRGRTDGDAAGILVPFEFASNDAVVLEFTNQKMRVWRYGALVMDGGSPFELVTPYLEADLPALRWVQSADVIYLVDGRQPMQRLSRFALDDWTIGPAPLRSGPFRVQNLDEDHTLQASSETGTITLTANWPFFTADHVGSLILLEPDGAETIPLWSSDTSVEVNALMRSGGRVYQVVSGTNTDVNPPQHTEGTELVGGGITWKYISDDRGVVEITAITSATEATAIVHRTVPPQCKAGTTYRWSEGAWSARYGYPAALELFDQRLVAAATDSDPRTVWFSTVGDYLDHLPSTLDDEAFAYGIAGGRSVNRIRWLKGGNKGLHVGALGEEWVTRRTDATRVLGPTTTEFVTNGSIGSAAAQPIAPDGWPIFIAKDRRRVFEQRYSFEEDAIRSRTLSRPAQHLGNAGFEEIVWQSSPMRLAWLRRSDGDLVMMLHDPEEDVLGWAPYALAGGFVESIAVSPDETGSYDLLHMIVRRTIDGETRRHVEIQALTWGLLTDTDEIARANHLFAASEFTGGDIETVSVPHLEGEDVVIWTDTGEFGPETVPEGGEIALPVTVGRAIVGLYDDSHVVDTLSVQVPAKDGNTMGRKRRSHNGLKLHTYRAAAGTVEVIERHYGQDPVLSRAVDIVPRGVAADLNRAYSGAVNVDGTASGHADEIAYRFRPRGAAPLTILASVPVVEEAGA